MNVVILTSELVQHVGGAHWPRVWDVRADADVVACARQLPSARRVKATDAAQAALAEPGGAEARHVVYCAKGGLCAQTAAATMRAAGLSVSSLQGGIAAWIADGAPSVAVQDRAGPGSSRWITRAGPKIDRIACPWFLRRFIDRTAVIHYVEAAVVKDCGRLLDAIPFDIPDTEFSHDGEKCSFDAFISAFDVDDDALMRVAEIVRAADTGHLDLAPEAAGLLALSLGLSAMTASDEAMLEHGLHFYDSLYAWARHAADERHGWTAATQ